ncbi:MAG TPA: hypothetical protein VG873_18375 [Burkholderiales bacterium]|nr:hypothetical protein [Burkholderiales bacterium]
MSLVAAALRRFVSNGQRAQAAVDSAVLKQQAQQQLDRDLEELERRGLARRINGTVAITAKGLEYLQKRGGRS